MVWIRRLSTTKNTDIQDMHTIWNLITLLTNRAMMSVSTATSVHKNIAKFWLTRWNVIIFTILDWSIFTSHKIKKRQVLKIVMHAHITELQVL